MRIVLVTSSYPARRRKAGEPSYVGMAADLVRRGHAVTALACREPDAPEREEVEGVRVHRGLEPLAPEDVGTAAVGRACRALRRALRGSEPAAVLFADAEGLPAALLGVAGWRSQWVDLGYEWPLTAFSASHAWWQHARALGGLGRLAARTAGAAIEPPDVAAASFLVWDELRWKDLLLRGLPVQGAHVLRPGVDTRLFAFRPAEPTAGEVRLQYQGPLVRAGGLNAVFLALQRLPVDVRLRIVAESTEESYLAELGELGRAAGVMDRVEVRPAADEGQRLALLREAHVFVQSRESPEDLPRYALEAAAAGVPVIAARVTGDDGAPDPWDASGVLRFAAGNPRELAQCVETTLSDAGGTAQRARRARVFVEQRFGAGFGAEQLEPLLGGADSRGGPRRS